VNEGLKAVDHVIVELIPDPEEGGFTARVPNIPAYGEGETEEEAIADLKEALRAYIAAFGLQDALARINAPTTLRKLDIDLEGLAGGRG
jgi:predicted RNase H-like HicB family nuclease